MLKTSDFLDLLRVKLQLDSDNKLAIRLGIHRQYMSQYRLNKSSFDDANACAVAALLDMDAAYVIACMHYQRAKAAESRAVWERIAGMLSGVAALLLVSVAVLPATFDPVVSVASAENSSSIIYIMRISEFAALILFVIMAAYYLTVSHHVKLPHPRARRSVR